MLITLPISNEGSERESDLKTTYAVAAIEMLVITAIILRLVGTDNEVLDTHRIHTGIKKIKIYGIPTRNMIKSAIT
jgi:hypothetical protein